MGRGTKACINGPGNMTKMATTSIYCKTFKISFSRTRSRINDDTGFPLTYFRPRSNFVTFVLELTKLSQIHNDQIGRRLNFMSQIKGSQEGSHGVDCPLVDLGQFNAKVKFG